MDCARCCHSIFAIYVRANSSILMFAVTVVITSVKHRETWAHGKDDWVAKGVQEIEQGGHVS